jgi:hypothetical protein
VVLARKGDRAASQSAVAAADELAASMPGAAGPARHAPPAAADAPDSTVAEKQGFWTKFSFSNLRSVFRR